MDRIESKLIDSPVVFKIRTNNKIEILNPGKMDQWIRAYYTPDDRLTQTGIYYDNTSSGYVSTLQDFIKNYKLDTDSYSLKTVTGYFVEKLAFAIKSIPRNNNFISYYKLMDILLRKFSSEFPMKAFIDRETLRYEIRTVISEDHQEGWARIIFQKEIDSK